MFLLRVKITSPCPSGLVCDMTEVSWSCASAACQQRNTLTDNVGSLCLLETPPVSRMLVSVRASVQVCTFTCQMLFFLRSRRLCEVRDGFKWDPPGFCKGCDNYREPLHTEGVTSNWPMAFILLWWLASNFLVCITAIFWKGVCTEEHTVLLPLYILCISVF